MSILIKGMDMPKNCDECRIMVFEDTNCVPELFCGCPIVFKAHPQGVGHRPDYCPLVEVPEPMKWIPVTERLPEKDGTFITAYSKGGVSQNWYMTFHHGGGKWYQNSEDTGEVTHWMPLPQPPKTEN